MDPNFQQQLSPNMQWPKAFDQNGSPIDQWLLPMLGITKVVVEVPVAGPGGGGGGIPPGMVPTGLPKIAQGVANASSSLDFTNLTGYNGYYFVLSHVLPATSGTALRMQISSDNGVTWLSAGAYHFANWGINDIAGTGTFVGAGLTTGFGVSWSNLNNTNYPVSGSILLDVGTTSLRPMYTNSVMATDATPTVIVAVQGGGMYDANVVVNGVRFLMASGNITTGKITVYGLNN